MPLRKISTPFFAVIIAFNLLGLSVIADDVDRTLNHETLFPYRIS